MTTASLDIEQPGELEAYLLQTGRVCPEEKVAVLPLAGGASNRTVLVRRPCGEEWVVKQALPKLRVAADWFGDPSRVKSEAVGTASVPSGASTGAAEARELRDGDPARYGGLGCLKAVGQINAGVRRRLSGRSFDDQSSFDGTLIDLDGAPNKIRLGANTILAVSLAFARAYAIERRIPLYRHFVAMSDRPIERLPRMMINLFGGGKHAGQQSPIQDVLIVPASSAAIGDGLVMSSAVYQAAVRLVEKKYHMRRFTADEGGLAPPTERSEQMFDDAVQSIRDAGFEPYPDVSLAVDMASSHFWRDGYYHLGEG